MTAFFKPRFFRRTVRAGLAFGTRRILREALASAIVTIVVSAAFTGYATRSQAPAPVSVAEPVTPAPRLLVMAAGPSAEDVTKTWFDPTLVPAGAYRFRQASAGGARPAHRRVAGARPVLVSARSVAPLARPAEKAVAAHPRALPAVRVKLAAAAEPAASAAEEHGFRVFGVAPAELLPTPSGIVRGAKSVGGTIMGIANWF